MKKILPLLALVFFYLIFQFYMPQVAEDQIGKGLIAHTDQVEGLKIEVSSFPAWEIFFEKRIDLLKIKAKWLEVDGLKLESFYGKYQDVSYKDRVISGQNTDLNFYITEQSLNRYLKKHYPSLSSFKVDFSSDDVNLTGSVRLLGSEIPLNLTGSFSLTDINNIVYIPGEFKVDKIEIPLSLIREITGDMSFTIDLNQLEIPIKVEKLELKEDRIEIKGGTHVGKVG